MQLATEVASAQRQRRFAVAESELLDDPIELLRGSEQDADEEVNLMYVALTRATATLYVGAVTAAWLELAGIQIDGRPTLGHTKAADEPAV